MFGCSWKTIANSELEFEFLVKSDTHEHSEKDQGSVNPTQQSKVTARNGQKSAASNYEVINDTFWQNNLKVCLLVYDRSIHCL